MSDVYFERKFVGVGCGDIERPSVSSSRLTYLGSLLDKDSRSSVEGGGALSKLPIAFLLMVVVPTLVAAAYFLLIASPRYVSESQFIVREASRGQASSLGVALQGVGLATAQTDAFAVHKYITSRDSLKGLNEREDVQAVLGRPGADFIARYPRPFETRSSESLYKAFQRHVSVGYDSTTGISVLRVEAFRAQDAQRLNAMLLDAGEALVNRLNERASADAVHEALAAQEQARFQLDAAQHALTDLRNQARFVDPKLAATESSELIGGLRAALGSLKAERSQLAAEAPQSPRLSTLDQRILAFERQIAEERAALAGPSSSLVPQVGQYEGLMLQRELAEREYSQATAILVSARRDASKQKLYLERIVMPSIPDQPAKPGRWAAILKVLLTALLVYGVSWMIWAGVREHRQD